MKNILTITTIILFCQGIFAQTNKIDISKELSTIYSNYNNSCNISKEKYLGKYKQFYDEEIRKKYSEVELNKINENYNLDYKNYEEFIKSFQKVKIQSLKNLLDKINVNIGRNIKSNIAQKDSEQKSIDDEDEMENIRELIANNLDVGIFENTSSQTLSTKLLVKTNFDGSVENVRTIGSNDEFNYYCALLFYSLSKKYKPKTDNGRPVKSIIAIPISLNID